ncbi:hydroxyproline-rich glycoprotein family protein isoform X1 [Carex rostrata]
MASYRPYHAAAPPSGQQPPAANPMHSLPGAPPQNFPPFQFNPAMNPNMYGFPSSQPMYGYPPSQFNANPNPNLPSGAAPPPPPLPPGPIPPPPPPPGPPPSDEGPPPPPPPPSGLPPPPPPSTSDTIKQEKHPIPPKLQKPVPPPTGGAHKGRVETEEERRARKQREYEKHKQEEKRRLALRQSQATVLQKTSQQKGGAMTGGPARQDHGRAQPHGHGHGLVAGGARLTGATQLIGVENRLKKQTTFMGKIKFRNELPDPTAQLKVLSLNTDKDRYTKYKITSLEKNWKPTLIPPTDLGIPLDLIDLDAYIPPAECPELAKEDEELLRDEEVVTPVKPEGIRRKDRPTDKGMSWLVKTQYISSLNSESTKMSITEKQAKEMREKKQGNKSFLDNRNNREKQIRAIGESFEAAKLPPVHQTNREMEAEWVLPLFPYFERSDDQFAMVNFDGDPTADSEQYSKLDLSTRDKLESLAIMKSFVANGSDPSKNEKFLAYMVPSPDELLKDPTDDEDEETSYSWIREYNWDVMGDDVDDPNTYLVTFDDKAARYLPLPTKLALRKKRSKEGRSGDDIEHFPVPSKITVRRNAKRQKMEAGGSSSKHEKTNLKRAQTLTDADHFSGDEISY